MVGRAIKDLLSNHHSKRADEEGEEAGDLEVAEGILQEDQQERFNRDMSILYNERADSREERLQREAEKEVRTAAEISLKKLHVIQRGRCPNCGEHLRKHLFASVCDACGWHTFDTPHGGPVRVHLKQGQEPIEGESCYMLTSGSVLVIRKDVVVAQIPAQSVSWVEYVWTAEEIDQRHQQVLERMTLLCGWCKKSADPDADGFHLVHVAFGATQERYCFCCDECYEAFRKMYPARVHRNCYERNCAECNLCIKRYTDEAEGIHMLAKDYLKIERKR